MCKPNSLIANLTISNELIDRIKVAQETDEELERFLTSLNFVKKEGDEVIRYEGLTVTS